MTKRVADMTPEERKHAREYQQQYLKGWNARQHPSYFSWVWIRQRCYNKTHPDYAKWGGLGIVMCHRWYKSPKGQAFCKDVGKAPIDETQKRGKTVLKTIDRYPLAYYKMVDNQMVRVRPHLVTLKKLGKRRYKLPDGIFAGGYWCGKCAECKRNGWPKNWRWATVAEQVQNSSNAKLTPTIVREIRRRYAAGESQASLCRAFGITACPMHYLVHNLTWKDI